MHKTGNNAEHTRSPLKLCQVCEDGSTGSQFCKECNLVLCATHDKMLHKCGNPASHQREALDTASVATSSNKKSLEEPTLTPEEPTIHLSEACISPSQVLSMAV